MRESIEVESVEKGVKPNRVLSLKQLSARALAIKHFRALMEAAMQPSCDGDTSISRALSFFRSFPEIKSKGYGIDKFATRLVMEMHQDFAEELYNACIKGGVIGGPVKNEGGRLNFEEEKKELKVILERYTKQEHSEAFLEMIFEVFSKRHHWIRYAVSQLIFCQIDRGKLDNCIAGVPVYGSDLELSAFLQDVFLLEVASLKTMKLALQQNHDDTEAKAYTSKVFRLFRVASVRDFTELFQALCAITDDDPVLQLSVLEGMQQGCLMIRAATAGNKACLNLLIGMWENLLETLPSKTYVFHHKLSFALPEACQSGKVECVALLLQVYVAQANALQADEPVESFWDLKLSYGMTAETDFSGVGVTPLLDLFFGQYFRELSADRHDTRRCIEQFLQENLYGERDIEQFVERVRGDRDWTPIPEWAKILDELPEVLSTPQDFDDSAAAHFSPGAKI